jgi:hypothetical protein
MGYNRLKRHTTKPLEELLYAFQLNRFGKGFDKLGEIGEGVRKFLTA